LITHYYAIHILNATQQAFMILESRSQVSISIQDRISSAVTREGRVYVLKGRGDSNGFYL